MPCALRAPLDTRTLDRGTPDRRRRAEGVRHVARPQEPQGGNAAKGTRPRCAGAVKRRSRACHAAPIPPPLDAPLTVAHDRRAHEDSTPARGEPPMHTFWIAAKLVGVGICPPQTQRMSAFSTKRRTLLLSFASAIAASLVVTVRKLVQYAAAPAGEKESDFVFPPSMDQARPKGTSRTPCSLPGRTASR